MGTAGWRRDGAQWSMLSVSNLYYVHSNQTKVKGGERERGLAECHLDGGGACLGPGRYGRNESRKAGMTELEKRESAEARTST